MAGGVHGEAAARAKGTARAQHGLGLLGEGDDLLVAEPEADAGRVIAGAFLAGGPLACDQNEHVAVFVVPETHLADLPLRLAGLQSRLTTCRCDSFETLRLDHLLEPDDERLDLRFLTAQRERPPRAAGEQEELAPPWLADRRDGDLLRRVELEDGHLQKPTGKLF